MPSFDPTQIERLKQLARFDAAGEQRSWQNPERRGDSPEHLAADKRPLLGEAPPEVRTNVLLFPSVRSPDPR